MPILSKKLSLPLLLILFVLSTGDSYGKVKNNCKRLTVAGAQTWYPYSYVKKGEKVYSGVLKETLKQITDQKKIVLKDWTNLPWKRAEINLEQGKIDILLGAFHTPTRANKWYFSQPLAKSELVLFSLNGVKDINKLDKIYNKGVSYPFGMATGKQFSAIESKIKTEHIVHHEQVYGRLLKGHTDFGLLPRLAVETYLKENYLQDKFKIHPIQLNTQDVFLVTAKNNPCLSNIQTIFGELSPFKNL